MESKFIGSNHGSVEVGMSQELIDSSKYEQNKSAQPTAILVARIISRTLLWMTLIIGCLLLLSTYFQSKSYDLCESREYANQPGALFQTDSDQESSASSQSQQFPISIRMNGRAGDLMNVGPGQKGQVNCMIERKMANQIIASEPKKLMTPFGNITTDPKLIHLTGEKLMFSCHSGDKASKVDEIEKEVEEKPIKQVIIISGIKSNGMDENKFNQENAVQTPKTLKTETDINDDKPTTIHGNGRSKRQVMPPDSMKKECLCNCAC